MCVILAYMKKLTTAIIAAIVLIVLIFVVRMISNNRNTMVAETPEGAAKIFLETMIPHHSEAVETSKVIMMDLGITIPEVRLLAARIVDAQEFEIRQMEGWYEEWFGTPYMFDPSMYHPMMTRVAEDVVGDVRAEAWLKDMIDHHEDALTQFKDAREIISDLQEKLTTTDGAISISNTHPSIDTTLLFIERIDAEQRKEIAEMKELLKKF